MKKIIVIILTVIFTASVLSGCAKDNDDAVDIYLPDGAPALALVSIFDKTEIGGKKVTFTVVPSANIGGYVMSGQADMAIVPTNMAAIIYNNGNPYKYISSNTHGNLFIVGKSELRSLSDLKGTVVGVIGQGQVPDMVFKTLLNNEKVDFVEGDSPIDGKVTLYYGASDGGLLLPMINQKKVDYGLLGEPAVTTALSKIDGLKVVFDIQKLWGGGFEQAGLLASDDLSDEFIEDFFAELEKNSDFALNDPTKALERINDRFIDGSETTVKVLNEDTVRRSNIKLVKAKDCKEEVMQLLSAFYSLNPSSVGGKVPDEGFFRIVK